MVLQQAGWKGKVVCIRIGLSPANVSIGKVWLQQQEKVALIASGDIPIVSAKMALLLTIAGVKFDEAVVRFASQRFKPCWPSRNCANGRLNAAGAP